MHVYKSALDFFIMVQKVDFKVMLGIGRGGRLKKGVCVCVYTYMSIYFKIMADSHCMAKTNTTYQSKYPPIEKKELKKQSCSFNLFKNWLCRLSSF